MIYTRQSMWETNSSTMNQIIIGSYNNEDQIFNKIIFHTWLPYKGGDMINNSMEKANIIYCLIKEIEYAKNHESLKEIEKNPESYDYEKMIKMLIDVLAAHNIEAMIDTSPHWNVDPYELDNFGIEGITDNNFIKLFENQEILDRFIFNNDSWFTFGIINIPPHQGKIGYTSTLIPEGAIEIHI